MTHVTLIVLRIGTSRTCDFERFPTRYHCYSCCCQSSLSVGLYSSFETISLLLRHTWYITIHNLLPPSS